MKRRVRAVALTVLALMSLVACATKDDTRFYLLTPMAEPTKAHSSAAIGVGPIVLPRYLVRPEIVGRVGGNQLNFAESDQWGGELEDNMTRVVASNLANLLGTNNIALFPWSAGPQPAMAYQVIVDVTSFEQTQDGSCVLEAFWRIAHGETGEILVMQRSSFREPVATPGGERDIYSAIALAQSKNVEKLSREIADAIPPK
jgi:uncharacterized lipoprotein YmbA